MPSIGERLRHIIGDQFGAAIVEANLDEALSKATDRSIASSRGPETIFYDPVSMFMGTEWLPRKTEGLSLNDLRQMAKNPIVGSIINTRKNQVAAFMYPQKDEYDPGYVIRGRTDEDSKNLQRKQELSNWIYRCGIEGAGEDLLETWARKFIEDSLILDQTCTEIVNTRLREPAFLVNTDSATIRRLISSLNYFKNEEDPVYAQIINEKIVAQYTDIQMIFGIRNQKTDITYAGYGMSELETLIRTVSTILNAERFNSGQLTQGGIAKGVLIVAGEADKQQMDSFKRDWRAAVRNASTNWTPPVLHVGKDAEVKWEQLDRANKDMEYAALFEFLVKQACGVYQIDPSEINWQIAGAGVSTQFSNDAGTKAKLSQHRGLAPLLVFIANNLNAKVLSRLDPNYRIEFEGIDRDRKADMEVTKLEVQTFRTVNEARADRGLGPIEGGDIILDVSYVQANSDGFPANVSIGG